jgi:hypothetical protein
VYTPNNRPSKYVRQSLTEMKEEIQKSTIIFGDFTPLSAISITTR